jgi:A/G-specific adenine glycosylase
MPSRKVTHSRKEIFNAPRFQENLLDWYVRSHRTLPWRAPLGKRQNPYYVWLSEIMLQQTTVPAVIPYFIKFIRKWPSVHDLVVANPDEVMREWAGLGYYARARNLLKCAGIVSGEMEGRFPDDVKSLIKLPGIGPYTAAAIAALAFGREETVIDANIERITARVFAIGTPLPQGKPEIRELARSLFADIGEERSSDFPQALMDLGAGICTPASPACGLCPVSDFCAARGLKIQEALPARSPKAEKPVRTGQVFLLRRENGDLLIEKRDEKRMLGGMMGLPTTDWDLPQNAENMPKNSRFWKNYVKKLQKIGEVRHSFTHFTLILTVFSGEFPPKFRVLNKSQRFWGIHKDGEMGLPTLFRKVVNLPPKD